MTRVLDDPARAVADGVLSAAQHLDLTMGRDAAEHMEFELKRRTDAPPIGDELAALAAFRSAAKRLKTAETEYRAAQQAYAEAVKQLSEEATK